MPSVGDMARVFTFRQARARAELRKLLQLRNYIVTDQTLAQPAIEGEFAAMVQHAEDSTNVLAVVFLTNSRKRVGIEPIRDVRTKMDEAGLRRVLLIVHEGLTPFSHQRLVAMTKEGVYMQALQEARLQFSLMGHQLVPKHELLPPDEVEEVLTKYRCTEQQLPVYCSDDPVVEYMGLTPGQVVRIIRKNGRIGE